MGLSQVRSQDTDECSNPSSRPSINSSSPNSSQVSSRSGGLNRGEYTRQSVDRTNSQGGSNGWMQIGVQTDDKSGARKPASSSQIATPRFGRTLETTARHNRRPGKVALTPGHSPLDWARLKSSNVDLRGTASSDLARSGRISKAELAKHNSKDDAWTVLGGRVYNITPYLNFHPGGVPQIMRAAGKDGTKLFMEYHAWVNFEMMLDKCAVGVYIGDI